LILEIPECSIDPDHLKAAFINILLNAKDAISNNGKIIVSTNLATLLEPITDFFSEQRLNVNLDKGQSVIQVMFEDNGCGIPDENIDSIFDPFYTTKTNGTGLGLPMVRRVINEHGGIIQVESKVRKGSKFKIYLPY